jgi:nitrogen fixation/metabolism regulation signal transduction histidine kinase
VIKKEGVGLGFAIVKTIMELHLGEINKIAFYFTIEFGLIFQLTFSPINISVT